jgi:hypothetical protein
VLATRSGATPYAVNLSSLLHHRRCSVCQFDIFQFEYDIAHSKHSTMTLPTASIRQHHHHDLATVRLHRLRHARALFGTLTCDIQRLRHQVKSRIRVPAIVFDYPRHSGATDEGMTPRSSIFAYLVPAKEEAHSKDTRSPQGPALRLGVEGKKHFVNPNWLHL